MLNFAVLVALAFAARRLREQFELHHRILSPVATMIGLVRSLQAGLERGGYTPEQRAAIYAAFDEQVELFSQAVGVQPPAELPASATGATAAGPARHQAA